MWPYKKKVIKPADVALVMWRGWVYIAMGRGQGHTVYQDLGLSTDENVPHIQRRMRRFYSKHVRQFSHDKFMSGHNYVIRSTQVKCLTWGIQQKPV